MVAADRTRLHLVAAAALDGEWERGALADRLAEDGLLGFEEAADLASRVLDLCPARPFGDAAALADLLRGLPPLPRPTPQAPMPAPVREPAPAPRAARPDRAWRWDVPRWETPAACALGLDVTPTELDWFADLRGWNRRAHPPLRHYRYHWVPASGGRARLLEQPKPRLAELQRRVARHVLARLPLHDAAHGFRRGHSAVTCAAPHAGRAVVVRMDLEGFFGTVSRRRIRALLGTAGYPPRVAAALAGLLTTSTPADVLASAPGHGDPARWRLLRGLAAPHLPQGAPSSPAVANAVAYRLDVRLAGLARALGARYTRYADDLAFSGDAGLPLGRLLPGVRQVVRAEGFRIREDKTSVAGRHQRQRVAGLVVNERPAAPRQEYDALRALLHNCARTGPEAQNRAGHQDFHAHLLGRIGWVATTHPTRAATLRALFARIRW